MSSCSPLPHSRLWLLILGLCTSLALFSRGTAQTSQSIFSNSLVINLQLADIVSVSAGQTHSLALVHIVDPSGSTVQGTNSTLLLSWGSNGSGQLSQLPLLYTDSDLPNIVAQKMVLKTGQWKWLLHHDQIAAAYAGLSCHSAVLLKNGSVVVWGSWQGNFPNSTYGYTPTVLSTFLDTAGSAYKFARISLGSFHTLMLGMDGRLLGVGSNADGRLGNPLAASGNALPVEAPAPVLAGQAVVSTNPAVGLPTGVAIQDIVAGSRHSAVLLADGRIFTFGYGLQGQLGTGQLQSSEVPLPIDTSTIAANTKFSAVCVGIYHTAALTIDGQVYAWGLSSEGQVGAGGYTTYASPVRMNFSAVPIRKISCGFYHTLLLGTDNRLYGTGSSNFGQMGVGMQAVYSRPTSLFNTSFYDSSGPYSWSFRDVSAGAYHSLFLVTGRFNDSSPLRPMLLGTGAGFASQVGYPYLQLPPPLDKPRANVYFPTVVLDCNATYTLQMQLTISEDRLSVETIFQTILYN